MATGPKTRRSYDRLDTHFRLRGWDRGWLRDQTRHPYSLPGSTIDSVANG